MEQIEQEVADRLSSDPLFADVEVHVDPEKNIVAEVERKLAQLKRLVAPVVNACNVGKPDMFGPYFDNISIEVGVFHNPTLAGEGPKPRAMAERVAALLHLWKPASLSVPLKCSRDAISAVPDKKLNAWSVKASAEGGLTYVLPQLAAVNLARGGNQVMLTHETPGAAIFYTTDGKHPTPRNGTPALGAIPFDVETNLKARAWLAGYLTSPLLNQTLTPE